jgi:hypothetical protein
MIPILPLQAWKEAREAIGGEVGALDSGDQEWVIAGPEWAEVLKKGSSGDYIVCPWCRGRGSKSALEGKPKLRFFKDSGEARCFREGKTRKLRPVQKEGSELEKKILEMIQDLPEETQAKEERSFSADPVAWAIDNMGLILDEKLLPKQEELGALFPDDDPLQDWKEEAVRAAALAERAGLFHRKEACIKGPWTLIAHGFTQDRKRTPCGKWHCEECGLLRMDALRLAVPSTIWSGWMDGRRLPTVLNIEGLYTVGSRAVEWNSIDYEYKAWNALSKRLNRWAKIEKGRGWLAFRSSPERAEVMAWGPGLAIWPLHEGSSGGSLREACHEVLGEIDLPKWVAWREEQKALRASMGDDRDVHMDIILAPSKEKNKIYRLISFILGWDCKGKSTARALVGGGWGKAPNKPDKPEKDYSVLVTYKLREVNETMGEIIQEQINPKGSNPGQQTVTLPCLAVPVQEEVIRRIPNLRVSSGPSPKKKYSSSNDVDYLLGNLQ